MSDQVIGFCKFGSETAVTRFWDKMCFSDLKDFIHGKWEILDVESLSLSYQLPGHSVCILTEEDDF